MSECIGSLGLRCYLGMGSGAIRIFGFGWSYVLVIWTGVY